MYAELFFLFWISASALFPFGRLLLICKAIVSSFTRFYRELEYQINHVVIKNTDGPFGGNRNESGCASSGQTWFQSRDRRCETGRSFLEMLTLHNAPVGFSGGRVGHFAEERLALVAAPGYPRVQWHLSQQRQIQIGTHALGTSAGGWEDLGRVLSDTKKVKLRADFEVVWIWS